MADTDTLLLHRWRNQSDAESFSRLVERHGAMVYAVCRRVLRNDADAEEVTQECFFAPAVLIGKAKTADGFAASRPNWNASTASASSAEQRQASECSSAIAR